MSRPLANFDRVDVDVDGVNIHARVAGSGPPLLLLHGYPQSSYMWRHVAPLLTQCFTVIASDLRGYGDSSAPADDDAHMTYSRRVMATDQVQLMSALGHERFAVAGHDRGGRVAHRMALDSPERVERLAVLDIVPTLHMFENVDREMAQTYFHWFFLNQPGDLPERLITADPEGWIASRFRSRTSGAWHQEQDALDEYTRVFRDPAHVAATCADYRAAASIDLEHDRHDRELGHRIASPLLVMWGESSYVGRNFDVADVWQTYADDVTAMPMASDHYIPEEAPEGTARALMSFFRAESSP